MPLGLCAGGPEGIDNQEKGKDEEQERRDSHRAAKGRRHAILFPYKYRSERECQNDENDIGRRIHKRPAFIELILCRGGEASLDLLERIHNALPLFFLACEVFLREALLCPLHQCRAAKEVVALFSPLIRYLAQYDMTALHFDRHHVPFVMLVDDMLLHHNENLISAVPGQGLHSAPAFVSHPCKDHDNPGRERKSN